MPEGDTIHRVAARLRPALEGAELIRFEAPRVGGARPRSGEKVDAVRAHGKHLLVDFSGGLTLRTHLRMSGSWHLYRTGEPWRRSTRAARAVIEVPGWLAVCFAAPDVALTPRSRAAIDHLGPDLCAADPDLGVVVTRLAAHADASTTIGEALLDQRVAAGIGNVYKSEVLHAERIAPTRAVGSLDEEQLRRLFATAHRLLRLNVDRPGRRRTVAEGYAVYRRAGRACRRCGTRIERITQGREQPRSTYWCPGCQL